LTGRGNTVAIVSDGSAVLGLGDIGPEAALPVMEGKAMLLKEFADIDAVPLCLRTGNVEELIGAAKALEPTFGGILLEDIASPRCFEVEEALQQALSIPVFHDDQHGTAVVVLAGLMNALRVTGKTSLVPRRPVTRWTSDDPSSDVRIIISGAGAAGTAVARMLLSQGLRNITICDRKGIISRKRTDLNAYKTFLAAATNPENLEGTLADAMRGADIFIGVSAPGLVTEGMVRSMAKDPIVFALANPDPEILPDVAHRAGAAIVATGRSDFPNQVNNLLAFPGIMRGALDIRAKSITEAMKRAASEALAAYVKEPTAEQILPSTLDHTVAKVVAEAVAQANSSASQ
jgi:malate dehydrogenase (oxaloacetate-decarboxylating)